jgi:DNA-binding NarL/FixJ family response regulator
MDGTTRVVIADDHPIFREGLVRTMDQNKTFVVVGQAGDGAEALRLIKELHPDIAILDVSMPTMDGIEVARRIHKEALPTEVVILTMYQDAKYFNAALDLGVRGYLLKVSVTTELLACLEAVTASLYYVSPAIAHLLVERNSKTGPSPDPSSIRERITPAELTILKLVAENKTSKEIAERLFVSVRTVENHRTHICQKLHIKGHNGLLQFALENKSAL